MVGGGVGGVVHVSRTKCLRQQECGTRAAGGAAPYQRAESLKGTSANTFDEVQESVFSTLRNEALYASFVRMVGESWELLGFILRHEL